MKWTLYLSKTPSDAYGASFISAVRFGNQPASSFGRYVLGPKGPSRGRLLAFVGWDYKLTASWNSAYFVLLRM